MARDHEEVVYRVREWLNQPGFHSIAFIFAEVTTRKYHDEAVEYCDAQLTIGDCSRSISISLDFYDQDNLDNTLRKLDLLRNTIGELRHLIAEKAPRYIEHRKHLGNDDGDDGESTVERKDQVEVSDPATTSPDAIMDQITRALRGEGP